MFWSFSNACVSERPRKKIVFLNNLFFQFKSISNQFLLGVCIYSRSTASKPAKNMRRENYSLLISIHISQKEKNLEVYEAIVKKFSSSGVKGLISWDFFDIVLLTKVMSFWSPAAIFKCRVRCGSSLFLRMHVLNLARYLCSHVVYPYKNFTELQLK